MVRQRFAAPMRGCSDSCRASPAGAKLALRRPHECRLKSSPCGLFHDYFVREEESGAAVVKLHQEHATVQIVHLAKDPGLLLKPAAPLMIPYKPDQSAMPPHHLGIDAFHGRFHLSHP